MGKVKLLWVGIGLLIALLAVACGESATPGPSDDGASPRWAPIPATTPARHKLPA